MSQKFVRIFNHKDKSGLIGKERLKVFHKLFFWYSSVLILVYGGHKFLRIMDKDGLVFVFSLAQIFQKPEHLIEVHVPFSVLVVHLQNCHCLSRKVHSLAWLIFINIEDYSIQYRKLSHKNQPSIPKLLVNSMYLSKSPKDTLRLLFLSAATKSLYFVAKYIWYPLLFSWSIVPSKYLSF